MLDNVWAARGCWKSIRRRNDHENNTLVPKAAKAAGIDFEELVWRILTTKPDRLIGPAMLATNWC